MKKLLMLFLSIALLPSLSTAQLPDFIYLAETSADAVVNVSGSVDTPATETNPRRRQPESPFPFPFPFEFFERRQAPQNSQGSGFIIDKSGYVLTNAHVIDRMDRIVIRLKDGSKYTAEVIGVDKYTDIALLKIESDVPFATVKIGDSDKIKVGQWVAAIGSPYGLDQTVTAGIISALRRRLPTDRYVPFIQTDAAINPGNSGGPLMDLEGNVIGINSQIISPVRAYVGASFAIPINVVMEVQTQLRESGEVLRGWLGVYFDPASISKETADAHGLPEDAKGVLINEVIPQSPAEKSGLQNGDIILKLNNESVDADTLPLMIGRLPPNTSVNLTIWRDGKEINLTAVLEPLNREDNVLLGLKVEDMDEKIRQASGLNNGVIVSSIDPNNDSPRDIRQFREGDIITHMLVNERRREINDVEDLRRSLDESQKNAEVFYVWRDGRNLVITVKKQ